MKPPTDLELLDAAWHQITRQRVVLWGQFYNVHDDDDAKEAAEWLAEQVRQIIDTVRRNRKGNNEEASPRRNTDQRPTADSGPDGARYEQGQLF